MRKILALALCGYIGALSAATFQYNVNTPGTATSGNLASFSGASAITNGNLSGDVTTSGSLAATIAANAVTNAKAAQMAATSVKCNSTGSTANATDCTALPAIDGSNVTVLATGSSLSRSLAARSADVFNYLDYCTVLCASTADQTAAWAAAAAALISHGLGTIVVPQGNFKFDNPTNGGPIIFTVYGASIKGQGHDSTTITTSGGTAFEWTTATSQSNGGHCGISDVRLFENDNATSGAQLLFNDTFFCNVHDIFAGGGFIVMDIASSVSLNVSNSTLEGHNTTSGSTLMRMHKTGSGTGNNSELFFSNLDVRGDAANAYTNAIQIMNADGYFMANVHVGFSSGPAVLRQAQFTNDHIDGDHWTGSDCDTTGTGSACFDFETLAGQTGADAGAEFTGGFATNAGGAGFLLNDSNFAGIQFAAFSANRNQTHGFDFEAGTKASIVGGDFSCNNRGNASGNHLNFAGTFTHATFTALTFELSASCTQQVTNNVLIAGASDYIQPGPSDYSGGTNDINSTTSGTHIGVPTGITSGQVGTSTVGGTGVTNVVGSTVLINGSPVGSNVVLGQSGLAMILQGSGYVSATGVVIIGQAPTSSATASFSATSGAGVTMTMSAATLLGTAADVGRVLTILDGALAVTATNASPAVFTGDTLPNGTPVQLGGTAVPTGFTAGTWYYVVATASNTFELATAAGGTAINSTSTGTSVTASSYKYATVTTQSSTTVATATLSGGTLSSTGAFANSVVWLSGSPTTNTSAFSVPLARVYPNAYMYLPASSPVGTAGFYYCVPASTTVSLCYNNVYTSGSPTIPVSLTAFSGLTAAAYTQTSATYLIAAQILVPANSLGVNGELDIDYGGSSNNSAGAKDYLSFFNTVAFSGPQPTTQIIAHGLVQMTNAAQNGSPYQVANTFEQTAGTVGSNLIYPTVDPTVNENVYIKMNLATAATDFAVLERFSVREYHN